jgi:hypothetical protein
MTKLGFVVSRVQEGSNRLRKKTPFCGISEAAGAEAQLISLGFIGPAEAVPLLQSRQDRVFPQPGKPACFVGLNWSG